MADPTGAIFDAILLPTIAERTVSAAEIEAAGGPSVRETADLIESFGLPAGGPRTPQFTPDEAEVLIEVRRMQDVWPLELRMRVGRVMSRHVARIAQAQVQQFLAQERFLIGIHRRWLEHELAQAAVGQVESAASGARLPGAVDVAIVFCDLKDFTAFADLQGDVAALEVIDAFTEVVLQERGEQLRMMKSLGDGFMLCYSDVQEAVGAAARIIAGARRAHGPGAHASIHFGNAIARDGDYFGGAVNLAARLLAAAGPDELVATAPVARATEAAHTWQPAGVRHIRGFAEPIETFRLAS